MIEVELEDQAFASAMRALIGRLQHPERLMAGIAAELLAETEETVQAQGRPAWQELAARTRAARTKKGTWPGNILNVSPGGLIASIQTSHSATTATIGSAKVYARIHQLGGQAGRKLASSIPERPYLPTRPGSRGQQLSESAAKNISALVVRFIERGI